MRTFNLILPWRLAAAIHTMREKIERGCQDPSTLYFVTKSGEHASVLEQALLVDVEIMSESASKTTPLAIAIGTRRVDKSLYAIVPPGFNLQECLLAALSCYGYSYNPDTMLGVTDKLCCEVWRLIELIPSMCDTELSVWIRFRAGGRSKMGYCANRGVSELSLGSDTRAMFRFPELAAELTGGLKEVPIPSAHSGHQYLDEVLESALRNFEF